MAFINIVVLQATKEWKEKKSQTITNKGYDMVLIRSWEQTGSSLSEAVCLLQLLGKRAESTL